MRTWLSKYEPGCKPIPGDPLKFIKYLLAVLAAGYILMYFSEILFWARPRGGDSPGDWLGTWLVYSLSGFLLLSIISRYRAHTIWALFLAGSVFGWLTEGVVVQTMYQDLPLSLSFTGLAWHALISVLVGWRMIRQSLRRGLKSTLILSAVIGLGYGLWAIHWWLAPEGGFSTIPDFSLYGLMATLLLAAAYWVVDRYLPEPFLPNRWVILASVLLFSVYFLFVTMPAVGPTAAILPGLLLIVLLSLRHNRQAEAANTDASSPSRLPPILNYAGLLAIPATAILIYALAAWLNLSWNTNWVLYLVTTPTGFILFVLSLWRAWRMKSPGVPVE